MLELPSVPLSRHQLFHSKDVDEAREHVARVFCPHGLSTFGRGASLDARHNSACVHQGVSLNYVQYGAGVNIDPGYLGDFYLLQIPLRGGASVRCGNQTVEASNQMASLPSPSERLSMRWAPDSPHLIVRFARSVLLRQLESLMQSPVHQPLVFDLGIPLDHPTLAPMLNFVNYLCTTLDATTDLGSLRVAEQAENYMISTLLQATQHNYSEALEEGRRRSLLPRSVRRAQEFLRSKVCEPVSLSDLCEHLGVSARSVQLAFKQHLGMGPMAYLRDLRLDAVHDILRLARSEGRLSVTQVAEEHGFCHMGHFCAHYQTRFGEQASQTLRRSGGVMQVPAGRG